ncbi:AAA family ATPase [Klebsiella variicola]|uniref:AAA family ATPase n=1 Tax=Klebsiella variicola TaxID=244366 RepID=UPI002180F7A6|nr:AAA family ATPase [Klebsiella variicola]GKN61328.1 hypothetical protein NUKP86_16830 [Klebsiella variicola]
MDKHQLSERDICTKFITPAIQQAGWQQHQFREEVNLTDGRVMVRGKMASRVKNPEAKGGPKRADYVLYARPNVPIAVLEAKQAKFSIGHGMQQALAYAEMLDAPFAISSNGDGFLLHDRTGLSLPVERELQLTQFPTLSDLWTVYQQWKGLVAPEAVTLIEQPLDEVRITVKKRDEHGGKVSFTHLSEGELQMLTVLGLMRITREDQCLFLLDEPDTHLNPIWKLRYFDDIEGVLSSDDATMVQSESQIIITTHDPMMVGSLKREQVYILRRDGNRTLVDIPDEHPQGMGVTGLLKSELFGLSSTLDIETERRLFRRNELFVLSPRSPEENEELSRLSAELADLGFSTADFRDPDYAMFVRKMAQHRRFRKPVLTLEEQAEQDAIADSIIDEILREEDGE